MNTIARKAHERSLSRKDFKFRKVLITRTLLVFVRVCKGVWRYQSPRSPPRTRPSLMVARNVRDIIARPPPFPYSGRPTRGSRFAWVIRVAVYGGVVSPADPATSSARRDMTSRVVGY